MKDTIETYKAVGEPTRFRALRLLVEAKVELCACEIIDVLQKPQYTISKSLGTLVDAHLIDERREGRMMMYSLIHSPMNDSLFDAVVNAASDKELESDSRRLASRLAERKDGRCVRGC
jgi:ArsR family transcriptional regulator